MRCAAWMMVVSIVLAGVAVTAQGRRVAPPARPLPGTDPTKVLFEMQDALGMLRGLEQSDSVARIEYWGTVGTMMAEGKASPLTAFKISINYDTPGVRLDVTRDGHREIQVVAGNYAWNEDTPGGKAVAVPAAAAERLLQLWMTPIGVAKAAAAAGDAMKVALEGGRTVVTFPAAGTTIRATLNELYEPETVEARMGATVYSVSYADYGELNDNAKADVFLPRQIIQKQSGTTRLDLTVKNSNTYNPYVVMPIPGNVQRLPQ